VIVLASEDPRYPARLRDLAHPPDPLWVDGDVESLHASSVAIVGTRHMTGYGERVARELAGACAAAGLVVVSGLAQGIDASAHRGALDAHGRTVAVLGEGIDLFVATIRGRRRPLVPRIRVSGALVSEYAPSFCAKPWMFAKRNATIAALGRAVVVVEAGVTSGALITAEDARRIGRALFAVPGPLGSSASVGTNALIASGIARALTSADDVVRACGGSPGRMPLVEVDVIVRALADGPLGIDELARRTRTPLPALTARVAELLLRGAVESLSDGRLRRV